jgi:hypothetical protein
MAGFGELPGRHAAHLVPGVIEAFESDLVPELGGDAADIFQRLDVALGRSADFGDAPVGDAAADDFLYGLADGAMDVADGDFGPGVEGLLDESAGFFVIGKRRVEDDRIGMAADAGAFPGARSAGGEEDAAAWRGFLDGLLERPLRDVLADAARGVGEAAARRFVALGEGREELLLLGICFCARRTGNGENGDGRRGERGSDSGCVDGD